MTEENQKLYLIFHGRFPSEKAASLFAAKSCEAFADQGLDVTLLVPRRLGRDTKNYNEYYGIKKNFKVVLLPVIDLFNTPIFKRWSFTASLISFSISCFFYLLFKSRKENLVYSNETLPLILATLFSGHTTYEMHDFPEGKSWLYDLLLKRATNVVSTNQWKKDKLTEKFNLPAEKILYEPNAVELEKFNIADSKVSLRDNLHLPQDKKIIIYVGMLRTMGMEKGIDTALLTVQKLDEKSELLLVGGNPEDIEHYRKKAEELGIEKRVIFTGFVHHDMVPKYLKAADIAIAPFPKNNHYEFYMSPMKVFEYMGSGIPIVATDLNSIREITGDSALLVPPDDAGALAEAVLKLEGDGNLMEEKSKKSLSIIQEHSWEKRAARILDFIRGSASRR